MDEEIKIGAMISRSNMAKLQAAHDALKNVGVACSPPVKNALKAISETDDELRVRNYIVLFEGRDLEGIGSPRKNPDGSIGEYFGKNVDVDSSYTKTGRFYVDWEHGQDPDKIGNDADEILGYVDWSTAKRDDKGIEVDRVLNRRAKYLQWLEVLIKEGLVGNSTEAIPGKVKKNSDGEIVKWPLRRDTFTVTPMEPRMLTENAVQAYKALDIEDKLIPSEKAWPEDVQKEEPEINKELQMDFTKEEMKAMLDENKTELTAVIEAKANEAATKAVKDFADSLPEVKGGVAQIEVIVDEADRPFKSIGENLLAVKADVLTHGNAEKQYPRLKFLKATGASEGVPTDGGLLLEPTIAAEIIKPMHEAGPFSNQVRRLPVSGNSNSGWINAVDETSRATGSRWGGIRGYRLAEAATKTASKPTFRRIQWELKKYAAVVVATDELLQDAAMFSEIVRTGVAEELNFMLNDDIMNGVGVAGPQGFMNSGALITVTRTTGSKILGEDISALHNRMDIRGRNTANWYIGNDSQPQLDNLFAVGSTAVLYPYASIGVDGVKRLYGRPIYTTEFNASLNTTGDIAFFDPAQYLLWEKGGVQSESSIHVYFLSDETTFRFVMRVDGSLSVNTALTPYKGSTTTSPAVVLGSAT